MKLKLIILTSVFSFGLCHGIFAQSGLIGIKGNDVTNGNGGFDWKGNIDAGASIGFGFPTAIQNFGSNNTTSMQTRVASSLGGGFDIDAFMEYWLCDNFGGGLDVDGFFGFPVSLTDDNGHTIETQSYAANMLSVSPFFTIAAHTGHSCLPYAKFGAIFGFPAVMFSESGSGPGAPGGIYEEQYTGGLAFGWQGGVGVQFPLFNNDRIMFHAEIDNRSISYFPTMGQNIQTFSGDTKDPNKTYVDMLPTSAPNTTALKFGEPLSGLFLKIGANINISTAK